MKKLFVAAIAFSAIYLSSCNSAASGDPKTVLSSFFEALSKKDIAAARKLATADSKSMLDLMEAGLKMAGNAADNKATEKYDKENMQIGEAKIEGDKASVNVKELKSGEAIDFILKKEDGSWKVAMDMGTMMDMGMKKMKEKGMEGGLDSLQNEIRNMNPDSLKEMMNKGMQMLDSLKKNMKSN